MRTLFVCLALGASAAANAAVYILDPDALPPGTNVSHRIPGVILAVETVPVMPVAHSVYAPVFTPLFVELCDVAELCPAPGGRHKFGDGFHDGAAAHFCFTDDFPFACSSTITVVLRAVFRSPPSAVSFATSWLSDDPELFAYDRFGNVVAECYSRVLGGGRDDCTRLTIPDPYDGSRTVITLKRPNLDIYSLIVVGSRMGKIKVSIP